MDSPNIDRNLPGAAVALGLLLAGFVGLAGCAVDRGATSPSSPPVSRLWYRQPAADWNEALPVGNGRLGAMIFGLAAHEKLQLNEETVRP